MRQFLILFFVGLTFAVSAQQIDYNDNGKYIAKGYDVVAYFSGKTIAGVLESAKKQNIPVAALCGAVTLSPDEQEKIGLDYLSSILRDVANLEEALLQSRENLVCAAYNFAKLIHTNK